MANSGEVWGWIPQWRCRGKAPEAESSVAFEAPVEPGGAKFDTSDRFDFAKSVVFGAGQLVGVVFCELVSCRPSWSAGMSRVRPSPMSKWA